MDYITYLRGMVGHSPIIMVAAGAFIFDNEGRVLLQLRADSRTWGHPGGFMELGESVEETARREAYEETGLKLKSMDFFGIYSGQTQQKTLANGDQLSLVKMMFICNEYEGELNGINEETAGLQFFALQDLPDNLFPSQKQAFDDLLTGRKGPFIR
jgi:ADP-ribose pyrophosphatase YjhB (NUDIX family)